MRARLSKGRAARAYQGGAVAAAEMAIIAALGIVLALVLWSFDRSALSAQRDAARSDAALAKQRAEVHKAAAASWETAVDQLRVDLDQCTTAWAQAKETADRQLEQAVAAQVAAERQAAEWKARWTSRPQGCSAALSALDSACQALEGY